MARMVSKRDPVKDISFLLGVVHNLTITSEFADKAIADWPSELCSAPVDGERLGRGIEEIRQKWISDDLESTSAATPTTAKKNEKDHGGTCLNDAIIIDDGDNEIEKPTITPILPRKFRIPPVAGLITPLSVDKPVTLTAYDDSEIVFESIEHEEGILIIDRACAAKHNVGICTPRSLKKAKKAFNTKAKNRPANNDSESESDDDMPMSPPTLSSTRKRRAIDYEAVPSDQIVDDSNEDYQYEEVHEDKRLNEKYDSSFPVLATPSKRQKRKVKS